MDPFQTDGAKERQKILDALDQYPYSFQLKDIGMLTNSALQSLRNHLEEGLKAGYKTSLQTAASRNLLAFALFQLSEQHMALTETEQVLQMEDQQNNIVALTNKVYMLSMLSSFDEANETLDELKELQETPEMSYLKVKAKAELAASYLRFGPRFNKYAIDAFKEVLPQAKEPEVWMWKYSLAVAYRHALDLQHAPYLAYGQYAVTHMDALKLFQEVTDSNPVSGGEAAHNNLKANAYAEIGLLSRLTWDETQKYRVCSEVQAGPMACCKKALELDDQDASVLWKSGKLHRNYKDLFKSRKLLEKAASLQPSSATYHHLGLTYKAMATSLQHGKLKIRRGGKRQKQKRKAREEWMNRQNPKGATLPCDVIQGRTLPVSEKVKREHEQVKWIKRAVKSPLEKATHFELGEFNVQKAIENLQLAVDFSAKENSRAVYDLALLYKAVNDFKRALNLFSSIVMRQNSKITTPSGLLEQITSLEQIGLIYRQMADDETHEGKRKELHKKSASKLTQALSLAVRRYSEVKVMKNIFGKIFHSPFALLDAARASDKTYGEKVLEEARIYSLINNNKEAQDLLMKIPQNERNAQYMKLEMEVSSRSGDHEKAVALLSCLKLTKQYSQVTKLFDSQGDTHFEFDVYFKAGRKMMFDGSCEAGYFVDAFRQEVKAPAPQPFLTASSPSGADSTTLQGATAMVDTSSWETDDPWDIMLLHDEEDDDVEGRAVRLCDILETACGLRVARRDQNVLPGNRQRTAILNNIENSRLVVIMPGVKERLEEFEEFVSVAAMKEFAVLLTGDTGPEAIPWELKTPRLRYRKCPAELFAPGTSPEAAGPYSKEVISSICSLFKFLVNRE
ncbi:hypothetical protein ACOMHN_050435 [Nucella lapillus]